MTETLSQKFIESVRKTLARELGRLLDILLHPRRSIREYAEAEAPLGDALVFAAVMLGIGSAMATVLGLAGSLGAASLAYQTVGMMAVWVLYALFLHGIAVLFGARAGARKTAVAYLYAVGALQPILVLLLVAIAWLVPEAVGYQEVMRIGGMSGAASLVISEYVGLSSEASAYYRAVGGVLIATYFSLGLAEAQRLSMVRAVFATLFSFAVFLALYLFFWFLGEVLGIETLVRLLG